MSNRVDSDAALATRRDEATASATGVGNPPGGGVPAKTAVVTGASSGIGAATARRLAAEGYKVICAARRFDRIHELAADIDGVAVECDVTNPDDVAMLADYIGGRLDLLVNNAGGAVGSEPVASADFDAWTTMYATNVLGSGRFTSALLPALRELDDTRMVILNSGRWDNAHQQQGIPGIDAWHPAERIDPCVTRNSTDHVIQGLGITWQPKQLALHPGVGGEYGALRWTAPRAGQA